MDKQLSVILDSHSAAIAFEVAMNEAGPKLPVKELLQVIDATPEQFKEMLTDRLFQSQVRAYKKEFEENGVSFMAKAKIAAEDSLKELYRMAHDKDEPAATRRQCIKDLVEYAGWGVQSMNAQKGLVTGGERFSIQFILNGQVAAPGDNAVLIEGVVDDT